MNIALLLSGGTGTRMGTDIPKQYIEAGGKRICSYCMETLFAHPGIDAVQIVADPVWQETIVLCGRQLPDGRFWDAKFRGFSLPGENRQMSIFHGLEDMKKYAEDETLVLVHDAARPLLSPEQVTACLQGAEGHDGVMPVLPMKDTVYYSRDGQTVGELLDRSTIYAGQAPEVFVLGRYYEANQRLLPDDILQINGSTEPAILAGMDIAMIPGDEENFKITTKADLEQFNRIIAEGKEIRLPQSARGDRN